MMGQRVAVEYRCDRCETTWYEDFDLEKQKPRKLPASLKITMEGWRDPDAMATRIIEFEVLCVSCAKPCLNYLDNISKDLKRKPAAKKKKGADAPPPSTQPKESPKRPTPSALSGKTASG